MGMEKRGVKQAHGLSERVLSKLHFFVIVGYARMKRWLAELVMRVGRGTVDLLHGVTTLTTEPRDSRIERCQSTRFSSTSRTVSSASVLSFATMHSLPVDRWYSSVHVLRRQCLRKTRMMQALNDQHSFAPTLNGLLIPNNAQAVESQE